MSLDLLNYIANSSEKLKNVGVNRNMNNSVHVKNASSSWEIGGVWGGFTTPNAPCPLAAVVQPAFDQYKYLDKTQLSVFRFMLAPP